MTGNKIGTTQKVYVLVSGENFAYISSSLISFFMFQSRVPLVVMVVAVPDTAAILHTLFVGQMGKIIVSSPFETRKTRLY